MDEPLSLEGAMADCYRAMVRSQSRAALLDDVCSILTRDGGLNLAWAGRGDPGSASGRRILACRPAAEKEWAVQVFGGTLERWSNSGLPRQRWEIVEAQPDPAERKGRAVGSGAPHELLLLPMAPSGGPLEVLALQSRGWSAFGPEAPQVLRAMADDLAYRLGGLPEEESGPEREDMLRALVLASPLALVALDRDYKVMLWNPSCERLFGWTAKEVLGKMPPFVPPGDEPRFRAMVDAELRDQTREGLEVRRIRKDGLLVSFRLWTTQLRDPEGRVIGTLKLHADITEQKEAEARVQELNRTLEKRVRQRTEELQRANDELQAFAYSVSHDLRAPLRAIDGFSKILISEYNSGLPEKAEHYLGLVRKNTGRMGRLIDDLLEFSRLGRQDLRTVDVNIHKLVSEILESLRQSGELNGTDVLIGTLPVCRADPSMTRQLIANLISNALKFSRQREVPRVEIGSRDGESGETVYFVKDNGAGFDMRYKDKLFGVFQRLHRQEDFPGTGVGLAIAKRVANRHGGRIWAEGEVDRGAVFYFTFGGGR